MNGIVDALNHQKDWSVKATGFVKDAALFRIVGELDNRFGIKNIKHFNTLLLADRKAIISLGKKHGLKEHAIAKTFSDTFLEFAQEKSDQGRSGQRSSESAQTGIQKETPRRSGQEEKLAETDEDSILLNRFTQTDLFGDTYEPPATQGSLFDMDEVKAAVERVRTATLDTFVGKATADYLRSLESDPNSRVARAAKQIIGASDYAANINAANVIEDAADGLDLYARAVTTNTPIKDMLKQGFLDADVKVSDGAKEIARAIEANHLNKTLNSLLSDANFDDADVEIQDVQFNKAEDAHIRKEYRKAARHPERAANAAKVTYNPKTGVVEVDVKGLFVVNDAVSSIVGKPVSFRGVHIGKHTAQVLTNLLTNSKTIPDQLAAAVRKGVDAKYGDLVIALVDPLYPVSSETTVQEERGHRANYRSGARAAFTKKFAERPAIKRDLANLQGYSDMRLHEQLDEVIAKNFRDDAEEHLGKTTVEVAETINEFIDILNSEGIDLESYAREIESVSRRGAEFASTVRSRKRMGEDEPVRTRESGTTSKGSEDGRQGRSRDRTGTIEEDPDQFAKLRRADLSTRSRQADIGQRPDVRKVGDSALISPSEARYIQKRAQGDTALAKDLEDEVLFARMPVSKTPDLILSALRSAKPVAIDLLNTPRAIKASTDLSGFRQASILFPANPVITARAFLKQFSMIVPGSGAKAYEKFKRR